MSLKATVAYIQRSDDFGLRQFEREHASLAGQIPHRNAALVGVRRLLGDCEPQPEADAVIVALNKRLEELGRITAWQTAATILDFDPLKVLGPNPLNQNRLSFVSELHGVSDQIADR